MSLQEEVIKLSEEMKRRRKEKKKQKNKEKNKRMVPNNSNSGKISAHVAQTKTNSVNVDNVDNSIASVVSGADIKAPTSDILQHSTSNRSFVLQHPTPAPANTAATKPTKSKG